LQPPFGHTLKFTLSLSRPWLSLGPGWAAVAGALSTGYQTVDFITLLQLLSLWLLVDPISGALWDLLTQQGLWRKVARAQLPPPPASGFSLPYAQPGSPGGRIVLLWRRYQVWWRRIFWPEFRTEILALMLNLVLALLLSLFLGPTIFWLTLLSICLTVLVGQQPPELSTPGGGRWQAIVQFLLPWLMGCLLWSTLTPLCLALAICYWSVYLGGLRMLGHHRHADKLFFLAQFTIILLLLAWRLLPGAVLLSMLLLSQWLIKTKINSPSDFLPKIQPYLVIGLLAVGLSVGSLA
jgi:hypothetical protein